MKNLALVCAALFLVACMVGTVSASDLVVAKSTLHSMGFDNANVMSDDAGMAVRGKGFNGGHGGHHGKPNCGPVHHQPKPCFVPKHCFSPKPFHGKH